VPRLKDKVAIITGAASGIGAGTAEVFAEHGAHLVLVDRDATGLKATHTQIALSGVDSITVHGNVAERATIDEVVQATLHRYGHIDIVFNNAGIMPSSDLLEFAEEQWDEVMAVNIKSMFLMCKATLPHMLARRSGSICLCQVNWGPPDH